LFSANFMKAEYNLLVMGDIGQIDYFYQRNPKNLKVNPGGNSEKFLSTDKIEINDKDHKCVMDGGKGEGLKNFQGVLCVVNDYIERSNQIVLLGDVVYTESKYSRIVNGVLEGQKLFERRLRCAWNIFADMLKNYRTTCKEGSEEAALKLWDAKANKLDENFYLVDGNHTYDVNYKIEEAYSQRLSKSRGIYVGAGPKETDMGKNYNSLFPRFTEERTSTGLVIQFLDINLIPVTLALDPKAGIRNEEQYNIYRKNEYGGYPFVPSYTDCVNYIKYLWQAMGLFNNDAHWRIIRSHHPPFNMRLDGEGVVLWSAKYNGKTFFDLLKEKKVKIWMASHEHNGILLAYPFEKFNLLKNKFSPTKTKGTKCIYYDSIEFENNEKTTQDRDCANTVVRYELEDDFNSSAYGYLWTFIIGNSGREIDQLNDYLTRSFFVYGSSEYGGAFFKFHKNRFEMEFFQNSNGTNYVAATVQISHQEGKRVYNLIDRRVEERLGNNKLKN